MDLKNHDTSNEKYSVETIKKLALQKTDENIDFYAFSYTPAVIKKAVVFLHGYGADCDDMAGLVDFFAPQLSNVAFYCPDAPEETPLGQGRQWFPLAEEIGRFADAARNPVELEKLCAGMLGKAEPARKFVDGVIAKIASLHDLKHSDIVLSGFSQGGSVALYTGLSSPDPYAGLIGFSTLANCVTPAMIKSRPPVLLTHGTADDMLPLPCFETTIACFDRLGLDTEGLIVKGMGHAINFEAISAALAFMRKVFNF